MAKRYDSHRSLTKWALENGPWPRCPVFNQDLQNHLKERQEFFGVAMQKAIVSDPAKAFGQDMLQDKPQEFFALDGAIQGFNGKNEFVVLPWDKFQKIQEELDSYEDFRCLREARMTELDAPLLELKR